MIKGIYVARAGMYPQMSRLEIVSNNLANINTTGFKRDSLFIRKLEELTVHHLDGNGNLPGLQVEQFTDFLTGAFAQTNNPLDVAIQGEGFFVIETSAGPMYTRNGSFTISSDGTLVTKSGDPVHGEGGYIRFTDLERRASASIRIDEKGIISMDDHVIGRFRIVTFTPLRQLEKNGEYFSARDGLEEALDPERGEYVIRQGFLEESNVDAIHEMVYMIELSRNFEAYQRMIQTLDSTLDHTMSVGRL